MKNNHSHKLKVLAGRHKDAELPIDGEITYQIGSSDECDIILLDAGVEKKHLTLSASNEKISIERSDSTVFIDGKLLKNSQIFISDFTVVTLGEAHLTIGPLDAQWPPVLLPSLEGRKIDPAPDTLVPMIITGADSETERIRRFLWWFGEKFRSIRHANQTAFYALCFFCLFFPLFCFDFIQSSTTANATDQQPAKGLEPEKRPKSLLLPMVRVFMDVRKKTLVGTGLEEPEIPIRSETVAEKEPDQMLREILKNNWGNNLTEIQGPNQEIQFWGYNQANQLDLNLTINKEASGMITAKGYTLSKKQKKEAFSQMEDLIQLKVTAADEMEQLCKKLLIKKKIKNPNARFKVDSGSVTLQGESDDSETISAIREIVAKAFPDVTVNNRLKHIKPPPARLNIVGVSTSGVQHVKMSDGSKVFIGGKFKNGCILDGIDLNRIILNCRGSNISYKIGGE